MAGFVYKDATLTIASASYQGQLSTAELSPDQDVQTYKTLDPTVVLSDVDSSSWTFHIVGVQDWETADALSSILFDGPGETLECVLTPKKGGTTFTFSCIAMDPTVGGERGNFVEFDVEMPVIGRPVKAAAGGGV